MGWALHGSAPDPLPPLFIPHAPLILGLPLLSFSLSFVSSYKKSFADLGFREGPDKGGSFSENFPCFEKSLTFYK